MITAEDFARAERERVEALRSDRIGAGQRLNAALLAVRAAEAEVLDAEAILGVAKGMYDKALEDFLTAYTVESGDDKAS